MGRRDPREAARKFLAVASVIALLAIWVALNVIFGVGLWLRNCFIYWDFARDNALNTPVLVRLAVAVGTGRKISIDSIALQAV